MCGITGYFDPNAHFASHEAGASLQAMTERLHHRGPDADGVFRDPDKGVGLGHRRLAVLDLSETNQKITGYQNQARSPISAYETSS